MSLGAVSAVVSVVATIFTALWAVRSENVKRVQELQSRLTKIETDMTWVVNKARKENETYQEYYYRKEHENDS